MGSGHRRDSRDRQGAGRAVGGGGAQCHRGGSGSVPGRHPNGPGRVEAVRLDFDQASTVEAVARDSARIAGAAGLAGLVNMAGIIVEGPLEAIPAQALRRQFEVNVVGPVALTQAALPLLAKARGAIVNIGAVSAHLTPPFYGPIAASKAALASLNDAMRLEFAQFGIRVFLIEPGAMRTGIFATAKAARQAWLADTAGPRTALSPRLCRDGARLREIGRRRSGGRRQRRHGGAVRSPRQAQNGRRQGRRRFCAPVPPADPPARPAGEVGSRLSKLSGPPAECRAITSPELVEECAIATSTVAARGDDTELMAIR